jgi:hypothetical protein
MATCQSMLLLLLKLDVAASLPWLSDRAARVLSRLWGGGEEDV